MRYARAVRFASRAPLLASCLLLGCPKPSPSSNGPADATPDVTAAPAASASATAREGVSAEQARAVVDAWLAAQNAGDFRAYEQLYAPRFEGVRRSGTQTVRLDRARWMRERERMFKRKTTVAARDIVVTTSGDGADVRFVQTWAQESYRDEGPKHMVLAREKAQLRIVREEMVRSTTIPPSAVSPERFAFVVDAGGPHLVLSDAPKAEWATGAPTLVAKREPWTTRRTATGLPADLAAWQGRSVELFDDHGVACRGTLGTIAIVGRVVPHFGRVSQWMGTGDFEGGPKASDATIARDAWELSGNTAAGDRDGRLLVAAVEADAGACKGALWGRPVATEVPKVVAAAPADAPTKALALAELRKTKAYGETQARYETEKEPSDPKRWEELDAHVDALTFAHPSGTTLVTLSITAGRGCGTFGATLGAAWELTGGKLVPVRDPDGEALVPVAATDVDGDGALDLLFREGLLRRQRGTYPTWNRLSIPFLDCGC
ncbi:MAG: nuclear transport factor 2 family protein [Deltaproteobacteria bacterium]|nr:nuclear transport factor 2 family protein [Deltaproteobacteria bacterium]